MKNILMVGDSERNANMLYAVGMFVPDPFIFLRLRGKNLIVLSDLELGRARAQAPHCRALPLSLYRQKLRRADRNPDSFAEIIRLILSEHRVGKVLVPQDFPYGLALELRQLNVKVKVKPDNFFPEREGKSADEVKKISAALLMAEVGLAEGIQALKAAKVGKNRNLIYHNAPLTADKLRSIIDTAVMQANGLPAHTIVSGGRQACDPHAKGHGPLRANQPIIIDVFPRSQKTGYFGDITRTVVKGRASEAVRKLYHTVASGQEIAFKLMRAGAPTSRAHRAVQDFFCGEGYKTAKKNGHVEGFFHGTGHGLGLELHEYPFVSTNSAGKLKAGHVVTVEPGLYYPGVGGVRLEDVALVTVGDPRNLTQFEKELEI
jgi:Xaa-Pro aminopeptidase